MNHKHRVTLHSLFAHPISSNIDPKAVKSVLEALGAEITHGGHSRLMVRLNGQSISLNDTAHDLSKDAVAELRKIPGTRRHRSGARLSALTSHHGSAQRGRVMANGRRRPCQSCPEDGQALDWAP